MLLAEYDPDASPEVRARRERAALRQRVALLERTRNEVDVIAGEALELLGLACDLLADVSGRHRMEVLAALRLARSPALLAEAVEDLALLDRLRIAA